MVSCPGYEKSTCQAVSFLSGKVANDVIVIKHPLKSSNPCSLGNLGGSISAMNTASRSF